jgi:hypothetical protein
MASMTVDECRTVLGADAVGLSDDALERLRDAMEAAAVVMYDEIARKAQTDPEALRWLSYASESPEDAYAADGSDEDYEMGESNLMNFTDVELVVDGADLDSVPEEFKWPRP